LQERWLKKGGHAQDKATKTPGHITDMGCNATTRPGRRRRMSSPREEATPPRPMSRPVAWRPPTVVARSPLAGRPPAGMEAPSPQ